jgi:hypothetical protein
MLLAFGGEIVRFGAVAGFVGGVGAVKARGAFGGFLVRERAQTVIFGFGGGGSAVVEGWGRVSLGLLARSWESERKRKKKRYGSLGKRLLYLSLPLTSLRRRTTL